MTYQKTVVLILGAIAVLIAINGIWLNSVLNKKCYCTLSPQGQIIPLENLK